jgi:hypothetical protein
MQRQLAFIYRHVDCYQVGNVANRANHVYSLSSGPTLHGKATYCIGSADAILKGFFRKSRTWWVNIPEGTTVGGIARVVA